MSVKNQYNMLQTFFIFMIPSVLEIGKKSANNEGNLARYGIYNELLQSRNLLYFSLLCALVCCFVHNYVFYIVSILALCSLILGFLGFYRYLDYAQYFLNGN